jgi:hypothetical protein
MGVAFNEWLGLVILVGLGVGLSEYVKHVVWKESGKP